MKRFDHYSPEACYDNLAQNLQTAKARTKDFPCDDQEAADDVMDAVIRFHENYREELITAPASVKYHHYFNGGYIVHITEVFNNIVFLVNSMLPEDISTRPDLMECSYCSGGRMLAELYAATYVHDLDKLFLRYVRGPQSDEDRPTDRQVKSWKHAVPVAPDDTKTSYSMKIDHWVKFKELLPDHMVPKHSYNPGMLDSDDSGIVAALCSQHDLPWTPFMAHLVSTHHGGWAELKGGRYGMHPMAALLHTSDLISSKVQKGYSRVHL